MRLSQAVAPARKLSVPFDQGESLNVEYRPASYTVAELDALQADAANTARIVDSMLRTLISWDLEYDPEDDGAPTDEDGKPLEGVIPLSTEALTQHVPTSVFVVIMQAMQADQSASAEGKG